MIRYLITDGSAVTDERGWLERLPMAVDIIQIREPGLSIRRLAEVVREVQRRTTARLLINDRADVALAVGAHGVHLKAGSPCVNEFRRIVPAGFVICVACHSAAQVRQAAEEGADYALLAPIFPPRSKMDSRTPLGLVAIEQAAGFGIPVIALGGITEENATLCVSAGAAGVAGISLFQRDGKR